VDFYPQSFLFGKDFLFMKDFLRHHKKAFIVFLFFLLVTAVSGLYLARPIGDKPGQPQTPSVVVQNQVVPEPSTSTPKEKALTKATAAVPTASVIEKVATSSATSSLPQATGQAYILYVGKIKYESAVPAKSTVYDLMLALEQRGDLNFKGQDWPGLGFFVEEINGVKNAAGNYWFYYINGKSAAVGITSYVLKANDIINWQYEKSKF
jgi:hypothetical protein